MFYVPPNICYIDRFYLAYIHNFKNKDLGIYILHIDINIYIFPLVYYYDWDVFLFDLMKKCECMCEYFYYV